MIEIIITIGIVGAAIYILINNFKKKKNSGCNCSGCSSKCSMYKEKNKESHNN